MEYSSGSARGEFKVPAKSAPLASHVVAQVKHTETPAVASAIDALLSHCVPNCLRHLCWKHFYFKSFDLHC